MLELFTLKHNYIAPFGWEESFSASTGFSIDQLRLVVAAFLSVLVAPGIRLFSAPKLRNLYSILTGFALIYYPFGSGVIHVFPPAFLTFCTLHLIPRKAGTLAWLICFPYLIAMHVANASGEAWYRGELDFTGGEMVLVLKLISVAVCLQDFHDKKPEEMSDYQKQHHISRPPGLLEYLGYVLCLGNLLAGPFFEFSDYQQWIYSTGVYDKKAGKCPLGLGHALQCFLFSLVCLAVYCAALPIFTVDNLVASYSHWNVVGRLTFMIFIACTLRLKFYFIWPLAECSLTLAGLNFKGWGEISKAAEWGRCRNVDMYHVELQPSARVLPQYWNICTGVFLRRYVYERLTPKGQRPSFFTLSATQLVSAVWHGLFPGYPLFFISAAVLFNTSTVLYKIEQNKFPAWLQRNFLWHCFKVYITAVQLDYSAMAFIRLGFWATLDTWASVYYLPHIYMLVLMLLGKTSLVRSPRGDKKAGAAGKQGQAAGADAAAGAANGSANGGGEAEHVDMMQVKDGELKKVD